MYSALSMSPLTSDSWALPVASAPAAFRVRVWQITSQAGGHPEGERRRSVLMLLALNRCVSNDGDLGGGLRGGPNRESQLTETSA